MKKKKATPDEVRARYKDAVNRLSFVVPRLVTHSPKLSAAEANIVTPLDAVVPAFAGMESCVGSHGIPFADKLDCSTNSADIPVLKLVRAFLGAGEGEGADDQPLNADAALVATVIEETLPATTGMASALASLQAGTVVTSYVHHGLPQVLIPDGDSYLSLTPLACGAVQRELKRAVIDFELGEKVKAKADRTYKRRWARAVSWQSAVGKMNNNSSAVWHRGSGALHSVPPVASRESRMAMRFDRAPTAALAALSADLSRWSRSHLYWKRRTLSAIARGYTMTGTSARMNEREDNAVRHLFDGIVERLRDVFVEAAMPLPNAQRVAVACAQWLEGEFKSVSAATLGRWQGIAFAAAGDVFTEGAQ